jgi:hypothetical protein
MMLTKSNLGRHCREIHDCKSKALKENQPPKKSRFPHWKIFTQDPSKYDGECYSPCIYNHLCSDVENESDEELLSRTKIKKRTLKAFEKEHEKVKTTVKKHIELEYAEPTKASMKLLDMCGNPKIKFHRGKLSKKSVKEIKKYSKLHCVQW